MAKRLPRSLVALSASVVAAIYTAGYIRTQLADANLATAERVPIVTTTVNPTAQPGVAILVRIPSDRPSQESSRSDGQTPTAELGVYKDGAYEGAGRSRRGDVEVTITIQGGRITRVSLDTVTTQYPVRYIAGLPAQAIAR
jgi:uncharacterized protein with FMN-binding domain